MYGESNMETYITVCKIDSKQGLCVNLEVWDGAGGGRGIQEGGDICIPMADSY